jgi:hypothetical protein
MMSDDDKKERKWAANIAFVGDESKVKKLIEYFKEEEKNGGISDFTRIDGPYEKLQDMLKDRAKNLSLPSPSSPESSQSTESDLIAYKSDYEDDILDDDYEEDSDE